MIDKVLSDLRDIQSNIDTEFKVWFTFAVDMAKSVGVEPSLPRTARCWSRYRNNVPGEDSETSFYCISSTERSNYKSPRSSVRQKSHRNICFIAINLFIYFVYPNFDIEQSSTKFHELFKTEFNLATPFTIFRSEVKK